jgi:hypothetical protein
MELATIIGIVAFAAVIFLLVRARKGKPIVLTGGSTRTSYSSSQPPRQQNTGSGVAPSPQAVPSGEMVPDGKYVVRYSYEKAVGETVWVGFQITVGLHQGRSLVMVLDSRKTKKAIAERSGGWIDWLMYEEDPKGKDLYQAINQSIAGQFMVSVKEGRVKKVYDPGENWEQVIRQFATEWVITPGEDGWQSTFDVCKKFYSQMDSIPKVDGETAKERALARWVMAAVKEGKPTFRPEVRVWRDSIRSKLCDEFNARNQANGGSMKNWLGNHGFEEE